MAGVPGMSALEAILPAAEELEQEILQYLNIHDVWNMRKTNRNMNGLLFGKHREHIDENGNVVVDNQNTTLSFIRARCQEMRSHQDILGVNVVRACMNGPLDDVQMKYCEGQELLGNHGADAAGRLNVCRDCITLGGIERIATEDPIFNLHLIPVCRTCQVQEENAYPEGYNSCICKEEVRGGWKCDSCCKQSLRIVRGRARQRTEELYYTHRDQYGRVTRTEIIRYRMACRCGRPRGRNQQSVRFCLCCDGVVVSPTNNGRVIKRSERIRELKRRRETRWE